MGVKDIKQHVPTQCPIIKSYRSTLTESLLLTTAAPNHHHQHTRAVYHHNATDYPILNESSNKNWNYTNNTLINTDDHETRTPTTDSTIRYNIPTRFYESMYLADMPTAGRRYTGADKTKYN
ncbi:unnamed protein product [Rotaria socialis]|uniref:Uncharacterized protein n=1 Tax=Rotaria socialis TaxID=392032 RepID=A0A817V063_9BILA|nr:unnamed protein product [Rotaria socialis]CAF4524597.1 unnamed protein product [Rotaria socialis]CAF4549084.1 unnamed protein product [Rotaria socialis]CAF4760336.1 unnamed protein product [Rotaria socialis]